MFKYFLLFVLMPLGFAAAQQPVKPNPVWPRPVIIPVPAGRADSSWFISLNGQWKSTANPGKNFWTDTASTAGWSAAGNSRGFGSRMVTVFKRFAAVPAAFKGKHVILRFDGVAGAVKVWVNGIYVREHWGSLMPWTADVTKTVKPGKQIIITLQVDDRPTGLAAFVRGGGIQKDVSLFAVPENYITRLQAETDFDKDYKNAVLKATVGLSLNNGKGQQVGFKLKDAAGLDVPIKTNKVMVHSSAPDVTISIPVTAPLKWDAEHPNLYTLEASVMNNNKVVETISKKIGFKQMEVRGQQVFINGKEIKLRGLWGGNDIRQMVSGNVNHTRQKWATDRLLNDCDSLGVYVLDEVPTDFAKNGVPDDPKFTDQYLSLIADLIERDRTHPSIMMWGLGNESFYGANVKKTFDYTYAEDPQRLSMFSWAHRIPGADPLPYTAYSYHYPQFDADLAGYGAATFNSRSWIADRKPQPQIPVIADEMVHVPLVNREEQKRDPNVRNFWGESIKIFWENFFNTKGALGGDIFGLGDQNTLRHMPEYWLMKKAYSPMRIKDSAVANPGAGKQLFIPVKNWFDHTYLNEIEIDWTAGTDHGSFEGPSLIQPHSQGILNIPARDWRDGDVLNLKFIRKRDRQLIDEYNLPVNPAARKVSTPAGPAPKVDEDFYNIKVSGKDFELTFAKSTGLITDGTFKNVHIIKGGPFLQLGASNISMAEWFLKSVNAKLEGNEVVVSISGGYAPVEVSYKIRIDGTGRMAVNYTLDELPLLPPVAKRVPWDGTDVGGYTEVGLWFPLTDSVDRLKWSRKSLWSVYPDDHIGRSEGVASKSPDGSAFWPGQEESQLFGGSQPGLHGSNDFRAMKEYIYKASAFIEQSGIGLSAESNARDGLRLETIPDQPYKGNVRFIINNQWNYTQLAQGNYMKPAIIVKKGYTDGVIIRLDKVH